MTVFLTVCDTCKRPGWDPEIDPRTDGEKLADQVRRHSAGARGVTMRTHSCLMGCDFGCNVALQSQGKITYSLGTFEPTPDAAQAIVEFACKYAASDTGQVPYREWPQGIKGHFRSRIPPAPAEDGTP